MTDALDMDAVVAAVDLVGRSGATHFEIGWLNDEDDPAFAARGPEWWAKAQYRGVRLIVEGFEQPDRAAEALAARVLAGARCAWCGSAVVLEGVSDDVIGVRLADGSEVGVCTWTRSGTRWDRSCDVDERAVDANRTTVVDAAAAWTRTLDGSTAVRKPNRAERRAAQRRGR